MFRYQAWARTVLMRQAVSPYAWPFGAHEDSPSAFGEFLQDRCASSRSGCSRGWIRTLSVMPPNTRLFAGAGLGEFQPIGSISIRIAPQGPCCVIGQALGAGLERCRYADRRMFIWPISTQRLVPAPTRNTQTLKTGSRSCRRVKTSSEMFVAGGFAQGWR